MVYTPGSGGRVEVVVPANVSVSVSIARASGGALTVYSDAARTASVAMPATATGTSTFYLADDDLYTLGATVSGVQCASFGGTVGAATLYIRGDTTLTLNTDRETAETAGANAAFAPITGSAAYGSVLQWNGSDYQPTGSKAITTPKIFYGPTDPSTVSGVALNSFDMWMASQ